VDLGMAYLDQIFFGVMPYLAITLFLLVSIQRYRSQRFTYSSLSTQFLENEQHFWALVPFHYGILTVLAGHLIAFCIPHQVLAWNGSPLRLYILEVTALIFGLMTLIGLVVILVRRWVFVKARTVTSPSDWVLYFLLLVQAFTGGDRGIETSLGNMHKAEPDMAAKQGLNPALFQYIGAAMVAMKRDG
jgi:nitrate reductase gamma subunit